MQLLRGLSLYLVSSHNQAPLKPDRSGSSVFSVGCTQVNCQQTAAGTPFVFLFLRPYVLVVQYFCLGFCVSQVGRVKKQEGSDMFRDPIQQRILSDVTSCRNK